jgi:hypothetical protein
VHPLQAGRPSSLNRGVRTCPRRRGYVVGQVVTRARHLVRTYTGSSRTRDDRMRRRRRTGWVARARQVVELHGGNASEWPFG